MKERYIELIEKMTLKEKAYMMSGKDTWSTVSYEQYGIPVMTMSDGPNGVRRQEGEADHLGLNASLPATCFPTAATVANSWDLELGEQIGEALGEEAASQGVNVLLGPGLNIKRSPLCGRNFEYFSEDPYLSGKMAASYIRGIQKKGIAACPKHFAVNSQELRRMSMDSVVDERTLRELYLTGFEIAVKEGKAKAIMSSYNQVNEVYANENAHLLQEILVDEWGFDGYVVSDWGGSNDHALGIKNGSHLEMPGTGEDGANQILQAIEKGILTEQELDERLSELLDVIFTTQEGTMRYKGKAFDQEAHHELAKRAAVESIVLLKNDNHILPLKKKTKAALIGDFAENARYQGAGSSMVNPTKVDSLKEVLEYSDLELVGYAKGYKRDGKTNAAYIKDAVRLAEQAEIVLLCVGLDEMSESEGLDRTNMKMPQGQLELIQALTKIATPIIAILSAGSAIEMDWVDSVEGVVHGYLSGQAGAKAMEEVLLGKKNPSGKLAETYPIAYGDTPAYHYYPSKERSSEYREGIYVGYRYYDTVGKKVRYPFGYGLSYTEFCYENLECTQEAVTFEITNTGSVEGAEISQLYIGKKSDDIFRPKKELKGFAKVFLKAGETKKVTIPLDDKAFRYFNTETNRWEEEAGIYQIYVGKNVEEICLTGIIERVGTEAVLSYDKNKFADYFLGEITKVSDDTFETLLGHEIPDGSWKGRRNLQMNDAFCQMYAGGILAKIVWAVLTVIKKCSEFRGKPNLNILFIYNMPFRGLAKMTGGVITMQGAEGILKLANGHFLKGLVQLLQSFSRKRKK